MRMIVILLLGILSAPTYAQSSGSLEEYTRLALENHPELKGIQADAIATDFQAQSVGRLPEPSLTIGYFPGTYHFSVMQMIPWPSKLSTAQDVARAGRGLVEAKRREAARARIREVEEAYWDLWLLKELQEGLREQEVLLEGALVALQARVEVGQLRASSLHQLHLQQSMLANRRAALQAQEIQAQTSMARALGEDLPRVFSVSFDASSLVPGIRLDAESLLESTNQHPSIQQLEAAEKQLASESARAKTMGYPDFSVGFQVEEGMHPYMAMFSITLPIWRGSYQSGVDAVEASKIALGFEKETIRQTLRAELRQLITRAADAARQIELYQTTLIPQAEAIFSSALSEFEQDSGVATLILAQRDLVELRLEAAERVVEYQKTMARIKELTHGS
jgi:outer membrane protein TolC